MIGNGVTGWVWGLGFR